MSSWLKAKSPTASAYVEPLRLGIPKGFPSGGHSGKESRSRRGYRHPDLWRFPRLQPSLPHYRHGRLHLHKRDVPGSPSTGGEKTRGHIPAYGKDRKAFDAPEWLAAMCSHVPNPGEQMVRYYGWYSNVSRGKRQKSTEDHTVPNIIESDRAPAACRKSWARLIQKIYEVDPLTCPICRGTMRVISTIEDQEVIKSILNHLGLWIAGSRPRAKAHAPPVRAYVADGSCSTGLPDNTCGDPCYSWDTYITT